MGRIVDGRRETLLVVESSQADVPWTAPIDLDARTGGLAHLEAPASAPRGPTTPHPSGLNALAADGAAFRLDPAKLRQALIAVTTIAGGETTWPNELRPERSSSAVPASLFDPSGLSTSLSSRV